MPRPTPTWVAQEASRGESLYTVHSPESEPARPPTTPSSRAAAVTQGPIWASRVRTATRVISNAPPVRVEGSTKWHGCGGKHLRLTDVHETTRRRPPSAPAWMPSNKRRRPHPARAAASTSRGPSRGSPRQASFIVDSSPKAKATSTRIEKSRPRRRHCEPLMRTSRWKIPRPRGHALSCLPAEAGGQVSQRIVKMAASRNLSWRRRRGFCWSRGRLLCGQSKFFLLLNDLALLAGSPACPMELERAEEKRARKTTALCSPAREDTCALYNSGLKETDMLT